MEENLQQQRTKQARRASVSADGARASDARYVLPFFILRIAQNRTETKLLDEIAAQVQNNHRQGTNPLRLGPNLVSAFLLPHISKEADNFIALVQGLGKMQLVSRPPGRRQFKIS